MMMPDLPEDLVDEILCRVPATSLKRLRSTCKRWNRLFDDKIFVRKHSDRAPKQHLALMLTKEFRICSMNVNLDGIPSVEVKGELIIDPCSNLNQVNIDEVFHYDGLLLCTIKDDDTRIVVWNPCTGQTRWIQDTHLSKEDHNNHVFNIYALGSYQDSKSGNKSYKILSYNSEKKIEIYEINSSPSSWRILNSTPPDFSFWQLFDRVSLKGKTYMYACDVKEIHLFLISFDYTTERFERHRLPYYFPTDIYMPISLSVVREAKLSVSIQHDNTLRKEIWVTNKIDETCTDVISWSKIFEVDYPDLYFSFGPSFLVDEEKKTIVCCDRYILDENSRNKKFMVYIVGVDNQATRADFATEEVDYCPAIHSYVPSLVQIEEVRGKRKRGQ